MKKAKAKKGATVTQMPGTKRTKAPPASAITRTASAEPPPSIVDLLRQVRQWEGSNRSERTSVLASVEMVLAAWDARGDLDELRALLGVKAKRKRKSAP